MSTAESEHPIQDPPKQEADPRFPEGGWALYSIEGGSQPASTEPVTDATTEAHDGSEVATDPVDMSETAPEEVTNVDSPDTGEPSQEPVGDALPEEDDIVADGSGDDMEQKKALASPNKTRGLAIKIGAGAAALITAVVGATVAANNHSADPRPAPSATAPSTPGPSASETASSQPTATESAEQDANLKELGLPSIEEFQNMTPKEQEAAIEKALPESLLSDPEMVYRRTVALEELIYNAPANDKIYKKYRDGGGLDYVSYIMDRWYNPLFEKLLGKKPSTNLDDHGALTFAYRVTNVTDLRYQGGTDLFPDPYRLTIDVVSVDEVTAKAAPYNVYGQISMHDTITAAQAQILADTANFHVNVIEPDPVEFSMLSVHYDQSSESIRAARLE